MFEQVETNSERWLNLKNLKNEIWKDIKNYEKLYQVSNYGRIKSLGRYHKFPNGGIYKIKSRILKSYHDVGNYLFVTLFNNESKKKQMKVHRLVAQAFIPNYNNYPQINHKNCIRDDNKVENLEWCTSSYNSKYAYKCGNRKMPSKLKQMIKNFNGENNPNAKLNKQKVKDIKEKIKLGISKKEIAKEYNISYEYLRDFILKDKIWK